MNWKMEKKMTFRKLVIGKLTYQYYTGRRFTRIKSPKTGKSYDVKHVDMTEVDTSCYNCHDPIDIPITPKMVTEYNKQKGI